VSLFFPHGGLSRKGNADTYANCCIYSIQVITRLTPLILESIHIPFHYRSFVRGTLNPISALCVSLLFTCIWGVITTFSLFQDYDVFSEDGYTDGMSTAWLSMGIARCSVAGLIGLAYLIYMCFAAPAVHYVRLEKKGRVGKKRGSEELSGEDVELGEYKVGGKL
jgi:hypothetical protein